MYSTPWCPYCVRARQFLDERGIGYHDIGVERDPALRRQMMESSGRHTVPQIWIGDTHIGGYTDMLRLERDGELDPMLHPAGQTGSPANSTKRGII